MGQFHFFSELGLRHGSLYMNGKILDLEGPTFNAFQVCYHWWTRFWSVAAWCWFCRGVGRGKYFYGKRMEDKTGVCVDFFPTPEVHTFPPLPHLRMYPSLLSGTPLSQNTHTHARNTDSEYATGGSVAPEGAYLNRRAFGSPRGESVREVDIYMVYNVLILVILTVSYQISRPSVWCCLISPRPPFPPRLHFPTYSP